jgi:hypothetical protein
VEDVDDQMLLLVTCEARCWNGDEKRGASGFINVFGYPRLLISKNKGWYTRWSSQ